MSPRPLVVLGGGEHARVVIDAALTRPEAWRVEGVVDPEPAERTRQLLGVAHLGDDRAFERWLAGRDPDDRPWLVIGVGAAPGAEVRRRLAALHARSGRWATIVHAAAWVSPAATLEAGSVVLAGAVVNAGARIEAHAIVNSRAVVEHDAVVGAFAHLAPGAIVGGGARIGDDAFVGQGALVRDHVTVGAGATVGMGAVAVADVPAGARVVGSPARAMRAGDG